MGGLGGFPLLLARLPNLVIWKLKCWFLAKSPRQKLEAANPSQFKFAEQYAKQLLVFVVVIVYSTLAPLILPFGFIYFTIAFMTTKYQLLYVYPSSQGGGDAWPRVFDCMMGGLFIYHCTAMGVLALYTFAPGGSILILLIFNGVFWYYVRSHFAQVSEVGALVDFPADQEPTEEMVATGYVQPSISLTSSISWTAPYFRVVDWDLSSQLLL